MPTGIPDVVRVVGTTDQLARWAALYRDDPFVTYAEREHALSVEAVPNDPKYTDGTTYGLSGANGIHAPAAWDVTTGSTGAVVADIDTGLDYNHPDIYLNVWVNQAEIPADRKARLIDTDGDGLFTFWDLNDVRNQGVGKITDVNGDGRIDGGDVLAAWRADGTGGWADGVSEDGDTAHVDDLIGWNFVTNTNNPMDDHGHGTHTAGTILAVGNDGRGVAGVNWKGQLMPLKFIGSDGSGSDLNAALAVRYAADHGSRVSNNSYGDDTGSSVLSNAIQYAGTKGQVFVAAAGNSGRNTDATPFYPSAYNLANIVSAAATDANGALAGFSNYGAVSVDVGAPGVNIYSTLPGGGYGFLSGTSMAAPHVAGVAALVLAAHPGWTYTQVVSSIVQTATPDAALSGRTVSGGIVNAAMAVGQPPPTGLQGGGFESPVVGAGSYRYDPAGTAWTYTGLAGVAGNGSGFTAGNPAAPEGAQVGFLHATGSVGQTFTLAAG
ncbi:MAG TPA: S8 family peptidase, partial [Gemmataceae bacterium]|nr:S8 family peptidase [Gemmataceae bacterium]